MTRILQIAFDWRLVPLKSKSNITRFAHNAPLCTSVADYQYFKDCNTKQFNIFRHNKYHCCLVVCEISTPYIKRDKSCELEKNSGSSRTSDYQTTN